MRPDVVVRFMDEFGDIVYNNYNATEAGMIATATPADLRAAPDTAGRPAVGTEIRILDADFAEVPDGEIGQIFVRNGSQFDGYTDRLPPRTSTTASWPPAIWAASTPPEGFSWSAATTR